MPRRLVPLLMALAVAAAACGQATPERGALPDVPDAFVFTTTTTTTLDPVPNDGSCYLVQSLGARVSSLEPGYDAANQLEQGDIITAIDGRLVTSQETLVSTLAAYAPTDVVEVFFDRAGSQLSADVELGALPDDASRPRLGVVVVPQIAATQPASLSQEGTPPPSSHFAVAENRLYRVDPLAGMWYDTGLEDPQTSVIVFNDTIYTQDIDGRPVLSPLGGGADLEIPTQGRSLLRALTTVGDVFVASVGIVSIAEDPAEPAEPEIIGVDLDSGTLEWRWSPRDDAGAHGTPLFAFRSPDGNETLIALDVDGIRIHTLLGSDGVPIAGFGSEQRLAPNQAVFAGWYDDTTLAFVTATEAAVGVVVIDREDFETTGIAQFATDDSLRQIWSVGDGKHLIVVGDFDVLLFDVERQSSGRLLARNCVAGFIAGPTV